MRSRVSIEESVSLAAPLSLMGRCSFTMAPGISIARWQRAISVNCFNISSRARVTPHASRRPDNHLSLFAAHVPGWLVGGEKGIEEFGVLFPGWKEPALVDHRRGARIQRGRYHWNHVVCHDVVHLWRKSH